jgi:hypothetical protein
MDPSSLLDQVTYDDEFRSAIRAIPIREITLPIWEIAKSTGSHVVPVGRPPLNRRELLQYLGVIADFKRTTKYETPRYDTLEALAKSATAWNWDANAHSEMLVLSNAVGLPFPPRGGELQKTFPAAAQGPRDDLRTVGNISAPPNTENLRYTATSPSVGGPPTAIRASPNPVGVRTVTLAAGGGRGACGAKATTVTVPVGGPPSGGSDATTKRGAPATHCGTHEAHEWSTEAHSDTEISEDSYYVADDYHSDDSGYDSDMYKKCWEDDF